jgi:hypothetical protein
LAPKTVGFLVIAEFINLTVYAARFHKTPSAKPAAMTVVARKFSRRISAFFIDFPATASPRMLALTFHRA